MPVFKVSLGRKHVQTVALSFREQIHLVNRVGRPQRPRPEGPIDLLEECESPLETYLLVPLDDTVVFPSMTVTIHVTSWRYRAAPDAGRRPACDAFMRGGDCPHRR